MSEDLIAQMSTSKVLVSILETLGSVKVPTLTFLDAANQDKELIITYEEEPPAFVFSLKDKEDGTSN